MTGFLLYWILFFFFFCNLVFLVAILMGTTQLLEFREIKLDSGSCSSLVFYPLFVSSERTWDSRTRDKLWSTFSWLWVIAVERNQTPVIAAVWFKLHLAFEKERISLAILCTKRFCAAGEVLDVQTKCLPLWGSWSAWVSLKKRIMDCCVRCCVWVSLFPLIFMFLFILGLLLWTHARLDLPLFHAVDKFMC